MKVDSFMVKNIFSKNKEKYSSQKIITRKKLNQQNLIFLAGAVIIISVLIWAVVSNLSFLATKINESVRLTGGGKSQIEVFNVDGFNSIRSKIAAPLVASTSTTSE